MTPTDRVREALKYAKDHLPAHHMHDGLDYAISLLDGHVLIQGWQPIETAPKDGTRILVWSDELYQKPYIAWYGEDSGFHELPPGYEWLTGDGDSNSYGYYYTPCKPTHWMPLPDAPYVGRK